MPKKPRVEHDMTMHELEVAELAYYPGNARRGDEDAIEESIGENGFFAPLTVQKSTGYILIGNHRFKVGTEKFGMTSFPCVVLDVDDKAALKINLADNGASDGSTYDKQAHRELLLALEGDFFGSTLTEEDLRALDAALEIRPEENFGEDDLAPRSLVLCPNCGHDFDPKDNRLD